MMWVAFAAFVGSCLIARLIVRRFRGWHWATLALVLATGVGWTLGGLVGSAYLPPRELVGDAKLRIWIVTLLVALVGAGIGVWRGYKTRSTLELA